MRETSTRLQLAEIAASADGGEAKADEMRILTQYLRDQGIPKTMEELISLRDLLLVLTRPLDSRSARTDGRAQASARSEHDPVPSAQRREGQGCVALADSQHTPQTRYAMSGIVCGTACFWRASESPSTWR